MEVSSLWHEICLHQGKSIILILVNLEGAGTKRPPPPTTPGMIRNYYAHQASHIEMKSKPHKD